MSPIAVGLLGAQLSAPAIWPLPVTILIMMAARGLLGLLGIPLPGAEVGIAASAILLGAAVMTERRVPLAAAATRVGVFAVLHGHAHGTELPSGDSALLYSLGFVTANGGLNASGIGIGTLHRPPAGRIALRVAGGGIGVGGLFGAMGNIGEPSPPAWLPLLLLGWSLR